MGHDSGVRRFRRVHDSGPMRGSGPYHEHPTLRNVGDRSLFRGKAGDQVEEDTGDAAMRHHDGIVGEPGEPGRDPCPSTSHSFRLRVARNPIGPADAPPLQRDRWL